LACDQRSPNKNCREAQSAFSSAIYCMSRIGYAIKDAIVIAEMYVNRGVRQALGIDPHTTKLFHGGWPEDAIDLPY